MKYQSYHKVPLLLLYEVVQSFASDTFPLTISI